MNGELLLEVRAEEIPARMLPGAVRELATRLFEVLVACGLTPAEVESGSTPRRLWLVLRGVAARERDRVAVEVGPPVAAAFDAAGQPTKAALGFAGKFGVEPSALGRWDFARSREFSLNGGGSIDVASLGTTAPKGERVVLERLIAGRATTEILAAEIPAVLRAMPWAKTMKWGAGVGPWVRPIHGVVALFDGEPVRFELFDVASGVETCGHPTLSPEPFAVTGVDDWRVRLEQLGIEPSPAARLERLRTEMQRRAAAAGGVLVDDPELLEKLAAICEIPGVMEGALDPALLELPREVLVTSLRDHQSALTVERDGALLPVFLTVMDRADDAVGCVRAGNEWVVAARLADARFFWDKDRQVRLEDRRVALTELAFHRELGSYAEKGARLEAVVAALAEALDLDGAESAAAIRSAALAKVDLVTDIVREFTSLQGVIGGVYARAEGEPEAVWAAIYDQYLPASTDDPLPRTRSGRILALADRLDTLVGFFGLGMVPTGSRDPFALRRAAQSVLRLLLEGALDTGLPALVRSSRESYGEVLGGSAEEIWALLRPFFEDRLRFLFELRGFAYDEIEAGLKRPGEDLSDLGSLAARIAALHSKRENRDFLAVVLSAKRIANITRDQPESAFTPAALELAAERNLAGVADLIGAEISSALAGGDFAGGLTAASRFAPSLEAFFNEVLVIDPDEAKRANRIALLRSIGVSIARLAELSELVVDKADYR